MELQAQRLYYLYDLYKSVAFLYFAQFFDKNILLVPDS